MWPVPQCPLCGGPHRSTGGATDPANMAVRVWGLLSTDWPLWGQEEVTVGKTQFRQLALGADRP